MNPNINPFDEEQQAYDISAGTIIDQAFSHGTAPPLPQEGQDMMTTTMPMAMPRQNQNQMVPNVMIDRSGQQQLQQQNGMQAGNVNGQHSAYMGGQQTAYMDGQQTAYIDGKQVAFAPGMQQQQDGTYDLNAPPFDIEDPIQRRQFFRKVFTILILQHLCALPIIELFILCFKEPLPATVSLSFWLFGFLIFIAIYVFSDYRRFAPVNYMTLIFTTLFVGITAGIYATKVGNIIAVTTELTLILQFAFMIGFSKQARFTFTNFNGLLFILFIYLAFTAIIGVVAPHYPHADELWHAFTVMYSVYDIQLQLSGHHGYLLKAEEHIFGACNIYADIPNLWWRLLRYIFLDHFVRMFNFFKKCCFAEVC